MSAWELIPAAVVISLDSFAASLALGVLGIRRHWLRIGVTFALVGAASPLAGLWLGANLSGRLAGYGEWLGSMALLLLGIWLLWHVNEDVLEARARQAVTVWGLLVLALSLSVDNLVIGFGLGLHGVPPVPLFVVVAAVVFTVTMLGVRLGTSARRYLERWTASVAGLLLIALAAILAPIWGR